MKRILFIIAAILIVLCSYKEQKNEEVVIPSDSIRLRVVSNSNDEFDIKEKIELKNYLEEILFDLVKDANNKDEVKMIILNNLENINSKIYDYLGSKNYKIDYGQNYFPRKIYKGVVYNEGMYDSLVITLGNGKGSNWWCVLFPPLCLLEENETTKDVEYQLFVSRIINNFK